MFWADEALGTQCVQYSLGARRIITLAAGTCSFERAAMLWEEMSGMGISSNTVEKVACQTGEDIEKRDYESEELCRKFEMSYGNYEVMVDGTCVNTVDGWREVQVAVLAHTPFGEPRTAETFASPIPSPSMKVGFAKIENSRTFFSHFLDWRKILLNHRQWETYVTVDGTPWIWNGMVEHFWNSPKLWDFYHASEHIHASMSAYFSQEYHICQEWSHRLTHALLNDGWPKFQE